MSEQAGRPADQRLDRQMDEARQRFMEKFPPDEHDVSDEQDKREAGDNVRQLGAAAGINPPPASQSAYQQDLAAKLREAAHQYGDQIIEIDEEGDVHDPMLDSFVAVLAAEGVVDPVELAGWKGSAKNAEQQLAEMRAEAEKIADMIYTHPENFTQVQQWAQDINALRGDSDA